MMTRLLTTLLALATALAAAPAAIRAQDDIDPSTIVRAELLADHTAAPPGATVRLALRLTILDGWHVYWENPGESGFPTAAQFASPDPGVQFGELLYPAPILFVSPGDLKSYGYDGVVTLLASVKIPEGAAEGQTLTITAKPRWLMCADRCIPGNAELELKLPVGAAAPANEDLFTAAEAKLPRTSDAAVKTSVELIQSDDLAAVVIAVEPQKGPLYAGPAEDAAAAGPATKALVFAPYPNEGFDVSIPEIKGETERDGDSLVYKGRVMITYNIRATDPARTAPLRVGGVLTGQWISGETASDLAVAVTK